MGMGRKGPETKVEHYKRFPWDGHPDRPWVISPIFLGRLLAMAPGHAGQVLTVRVCVVPPCWIEVAPGMRHPGNNEYLDVLVSPVESEEQSLRLGDWLLLDCQARFRRSKCYGDLVAQLAKKPRPVRALVWTCRPAEVWASAVDVPYFDRKGWDDWERDRDWEEEQVEDEESQAGSAVRTESNRRELPEPPSRTLHWRRHLADGLAHLFWPKDLADMMPDSMRGVMARCRPGATCPRDPSSAVLFESFDGVGDTRVLARPQPLGPPGEYLLHDVRLEKRRGWNPAEWHTPEPVDDLSVLCFGPSVHLRLEESYVDAPDLGFAEKGHQYDERLAVRGAPFLIPPSWPIDKQDVGMARQVSFILSITLSRALNQRATPPPRFPSFPPLGDPVPPPDVAVDCLGRVVTPMPELSPWVLANWSEMYRIVGQLLENPTEVWRSRLIDKDGEPRILDWYLALTTASPDLPVAVACCEVRGSEVLFRHFTCERLSHMEEGRENECLYRRQPGGTR